MRIRLVALGSLGLAGLLGLASMTACEGPAGETGQPGANGAPGAAGQTGPAGSTGASGMQGPVGTFDAGGALQTSCMGPCHGFNGIIEQWRTSTHFLGVMANTDEVEIWTRPGSSCGNCHSVDGLPRRLAGQVGATPGDAGLPDLSHGQIGYKNASGKFAEVTYTGASHIATIGCTTCHDITNANDPHVTGANYAAGTFILRVPSGPDDQARVEKSATTAAVTGTEAGKWGASNTCVFCHKSRKDVTSYITGSNGIASSSWGPHEAPHSDIFSGIGGYHFAGAVAYNNSTHQTVAGCTTCHMGKVAANNDFPDHSFQPVVSSCRSSGCHASDAGSSFDIAGGQSKVKDLLKELQSLLNGVGALTRGTAAPYAALEGAQLTDGHYELDKTRPGGGDGGTNLSLNADQAGALYNYLLVARGSARGVHNPIYTQQLLWDSINFLKGSAPISMSTRPHP